METGTHSIWVSEQLRELGHEVIVANVRELRPISHSTVAQQEALTLIRARNVIVRLRTAAVNSVRGLAKPCGHRLPATSTFSV
jgi:transposase